MKISNSTHRNLKSGFTLIEISLVIALLLGLIAVAFVGIGSYRKGADKAKCKMQLAAVQKAIRGKANMENLAIGATLASSEIFGTGKMINSAPVCPAGGAYTWTGDVPAVGTPYGNCNHVDGDTTHVLATTETTDW